VTTALQAVTSAFGGQAATSATPGQPERQEIPAPRQAEPAVEPAPGAEPAAGTEQALTAGITPPGSPNGSAPASGEDG
jgi:hypothetical protein